MNAAWKRETLVGRRAGVMAGMESSAWGMALGGVAVGPADAVDAVVDVAAAAVAAAAADEETVSSKAAAHAAVQCLTYPSAERRR